MEIKKHYFNWNDPESQLIFENETAEFTLEKRFAKEAECMAENFDLNANNLLLDYGCGNGKHAICFKKRGYDIIGYDRSEYYIGKAKNLMEYEKVEFPLYHSKDFFNDYQGQFDFIYTINFPFNYLDTKSIHLLFCEILKLLKGNGRFLFGFPYTRENREYYLPINKWEEEDGLLYLTDSTIDQEGRRTERYIVVDKIKDTLTEWIDSATYYYINEIHQFMTESGLKIIDQFQNLEKKPPSSAVDTHYIFSTPFSA